MAEKKSGWAAYNERVREEAAKEGKRSTKKAVKKLHPATIAISVLCLMLGLAIGAMLCHIMSQQDHFTLKGESTLSLNVSDKAYTYTEEGVDAVCFGRDVSDKLTVVADEGVVDNGDGTYTIPTDKAGVYTLTYTVDCFKFGEKAPNGGIKRVRVFYVDVTENDGRGETEEVTG